MQLDRHTQLTSYSCRNKTVFCQIFSVLRSKHSFLLTGFLSHGQEIYLFFYDSTVCAGYFIPWTNYQILNLEKNKKTASEPLGSYLWKAFQHTPSHQLFLTSFLSTSWWRMDMSVCLMGHTAQSCPIHLLLVLNLHGKLMLLIGPYPCVGVFWQ